MLASRKMSLRVAAVPAQLLAQRFFAGDCSQCIPPLSCRERLMHDKDDGPVYNQKKIIKRLKKEFGPGNNCKLCGIEFGGQEALVQHYCAKHGTPLEFGCTFCSRGYAGANDLRTHVLDKHRSKLADGAISCEYLKKILQAEDEIKKDDGDEVKKDDV